MHKLSTGGRLTQELVQEMFLPALENPALAALSDSAILEQLPSGFPALTTDGFVVDPPIFPGGDLGYLSVCSTVNNLVVAGARPTGVTWALVLEEGLEGELLRAVVDGAVRAATEADVPLVAGDTQVVPRGKGERCFAVTAGLGIVPAERKLGDGYIRPGDIMIASGTLGDHGATILACRHELESAGLRSDCAPLGTLVEALLASGAEVHALHDVTRGGIAATCQVAASRAGLGMVLEERALPVRREVRAVCELLGLEPLHLACAGRFVAWVDGRNAARVLDALHAHPLGSGAGLIGHAEASGSGPARLLLRTAAGGQRPLDKLSGLDLQQIC